MSTIIKYTLIACTKKASKLRNKIIVPWTLTSYVGLNTRVHGF